MKIHEYGDEKMITLHDLSSILIAWMIENSACSCAGQYSPKQQHCWRCCHSRECRWLNRVETGIDVMHPEVLRTSFSYAAEIVHNQLKEEDHFIDCCLCERCIWLRGVRFYQKNAKLAGMA
jgi:hypothetical protein